MNACRCERTAARRQAGDRQVVAAEPAHRQHAVVVAVEAVGARLVADAASTAPLGSSLAPPIPSCGALPVLHPIHSAGQQISLR